MFMPSGAAAAGAGLFEAVTCTPETQDIDSAPGDFVDSAPCTAVPTGGTAPITYFWENIAQDPGMSSGSISDPTLQTQIFDGRNNLGQGEPQSIVYRVTATDAVGTVQTDETTITWNNSLPAIVVLP